MKIRKELSKALDALDAEAVEAYENVAGFARNPTENARVTAGAILMAADKIDSRLREGFAMIEAAIHGADRPSGPE